MAEAVVSAFSTILFIVCFEKYYSNVAPDGVRKTQKKEKRLLQIGFTVLLAALFIWFIPDQSPITYLKDRYVSSFAREIGGENAVTAIYLGYRMYDTLLEALMLLVSIVAVVHLSRHEDTVVTDEKPSGVSDSNIVGLAIRIICPVLLLVSVYLVANGHISPGGGFHGGVVAAAFFVCRYMIYGISDMRIDKVVVTEKLVYSGIILFSVYFIFLGAHDYLPIPQSIYLTTMNLLLGIKVACGFFIIFYRFIAFERSG
jgi:multicomponent Na+:H+ antiporter subunit B